MKQENKLLLITKGVGVFLGKSIFDLISIFWLSCFPFGFTLMLFMLLGVDHSAFFLGLWTFWFLVVVYFYYYNSVKEFLNRRKEIMSNSKNHLPYAYIKENEGYGPTLSLNNGRTFLPTIVISIDELEQGSLKEDAQYLVTFHGQRPDGEPITLCEESVKGLSKAKKLGIKLLKDYKKKTAKI